MELVLDIETGGETRRVDVGLGLTDPADVEEVVRLCGAEALFRLADGEWSIDAAKAILYVALIKEMADGSPDWDNPPFSFDDLDLDWGELSTFMVELDPEMEMTLAGLSELEGE